MDYFKKWVSQKWTVGQYTPSKNFKKIDNHSCVCQPDKKLVCVTGPADDEESQKLSDLIAAAPELVGALSSAVGLLTAEGYDDSTLQPFKDLLKRARGET